MTLILHGLVRLQIFLIMWINIGIRNLDPYDQYPSDVDVFGYKETTTAYNYQQTRPWYESHDNDDESSTKSSEFDYGNAADETTTTTEIYDSFVNGIKALE